MEKSTQTIALAGLLHDIGKFAQRAGWQVSTEWSEEKSQQEFKYHHALHTWYFVNKCVPGEFGVGVLAAYHHRPQTPDQQRIRLADQLSAGERDSGKERDDSDRKIHPKQLHPIFTQIVADAKEHPKKGELYLPLKPLTLEKDTIFPQEKSLPEDQTWQAYKAMWGDFCNQAEALRGLPLEAYLEAMQALMQRYTWCIPSAYFNAVPDVSLYDHSCMTAALAVCLSDFDDDKIETLNAAWQQVSNDEQPVALLVGGDISGVQDFIYTISSKGAAKALRGRSFYLQLLTETVLRFVLHELELPYTNVIYSGGGHFFLLTPLSAAGRLPGVQATISRKLLAHHGTSLYLALGHAPVPLSGFALGAFPKHWDAMHRRLQEAKSRRYAELGQDMHDLVFKVPEDGGGDKHCAVCGADDIALSPWGEESEAGQTPPMICSQCRSYVNNLGKDLPTARYLHWQWGAPQDRARDTYAEALQAFGCKIDLLKKEDTPAFQPGDTLWALDDPQGGNWPQGSERAARWLRYTVNQIPWDQKENSPITFDRLQEACQSGFERLGVVRMDVDNLGETFKNGFKRKLEDGEEENIATLSRLSALSSQMALYFEGWVKRIIARDGRDALIYAVYAGGDDLFLIGPWDRMPDVALDIAKEFGKYTGHPGLHLSGGMTFIGGKYPVYQAAEDAGRAEGLAKDRDSKDAFAFLNIPWKWREFEQVKEKQGQLVKLVGGTEEAGGSPKSLLMLLRSLAKMESEAARGNERPVWGRWMWMAAYHLTRAAERNEKKNPALSEQLKDVRALEANQYRDLPQWGAAARWAQLLLRKDQSNGITGGAK
jgi:CRISPR-associated protein Csm1